MEVRNKKIFLDTNVLFDLINKSNSYNNPSKWLINILQSQNKSIYCSPSSFAITYYFLGKLLNDKKYLNEKIVRLFSSFIFTREDGLIMDKVKKSAFTDLEDALQYYSAMDAGVDIIITKNYFDFAKAKIPVYHPLQYIQEFLL